MDRTKVSVLILLVAGTLLLTVEPSPAVRRAIRASGAPGSFEWEPSLRRINKGDRIVWKNDTGYTHTVTAYSSNWSKDTTIASGERTRKRFRKKGLFKFRCMRPGHSTLSADGACTGMCGRVRVR